jgi:hypothetical protein
MSCPAHRCLREAERAELDLSTVERVGVDETAAARGQDYVAFLALGGFVYAGRLVSLVLTPVVGGTRPNGGVSPSRLAYKIKRLWPD